MFKVFICNSLHLSGKPVNPALVGEVDKLDESLSLALALHRSSNVDHHVLVYDGDAVAPIVKLSSTSKTAPSAIRS